jgi:hypothetical protein
VAGLTTPEAANAYLRDVYVPRHNATFARPARDPASAWVPLGAVDLDQILCHQETRVVAPDNTVVLGTQTLQLAPQPGRRTCARLEVVVRRHLDGRFSVWRGPQRLGLFTAAGQPVDAAAPVDGHRRPPTRRLDRRAQTPAAPQRPPALTAAL